MPKRATEKLTKRLIDTLQAKPNTDFTIWDRELSGFGIRVRETGTKSFIIKYRNAQGRQRKLTLGTYGALTLELARRMALSEMAKVVQGDDPALIRQTIKSARTLAELCDIYFSEASAGRVLYRGNAKKPNTLRIDKGRIERHIKPLLGEKSVDSLTRRDIEKFMFAVRDGATAVDIKTGPRGRAIVKGGQGTSVKAVKLLSAIFNYAIKRGWTEINPCQGIEKPADGRRDRHFDDNEYVRLGEALCLAIDQGVNPVAIDAIKLLALTGCRKSEILGLKVSEVDFAGRCLRFENTKTGAQMRPCGEAALNHLKSILPNSPSNWVIPAANAVGHLIDLSKPIIRIRKLSNIPDFNLHVLRHSYATVAHEIGYSELTIAGLLGHSQGTVTSRYAHHVEHALSSAADRVAAKVEGRMRCI